MLKLMTCNLKFLFESSVLLITVKLFHFQMMLMTNKKKKL